MVACFFPTNLVRVSLGGMWTVGGGVFFDCFGRGGLVLDSFTCFSLLLSSFRLHLDVDGYFVVPFFIGGARNLRGVVSMAPSRVRGGG